MKYVATISVWGPTWESVRHFQIVVAADAGGVQRVNTKGSDLTSKPLDVAVFTVQSHLQLLAHVGLFDHHLCTQTLKTELGACKVGLQISRNFDFFSYAQLIQNKQIVL